MYLLTCLLKAMNYMFIIILIEENDNIITKNNEKN